MSAKKIIFDHDALETVKLGVKQLADAVKITLGPRGRNVVIQKSFGSPTSQRMELRWQRRLNFQTTCKISALKW